MSPPSSIWSFFSKCIVLAFFLPHSLNKINRSSLCSSPLLFMQACAQHKTFLQMQLSREKSSHLQVCVCIQVLHLRNPGTDDPILQTLTPHRWGFRSNSSRWLSVASNLLRLLEAYSCCCAGVKAPLRKVFFTVKVNFVRLKRTKPNPGPGDL